MNRPVVLVGVGEMGGVFARGLLRAGYPVYPVSRRSDAEQLAAAIPDPDLVLVAVGEADLHPVLERLPQAWRERVGLLQNELLPRDWQRHGLTDPTVISVWFEKKPGQEPKVIMPSPVYGPKAQLLREGLQAVGIASRVLANESELLHELVLKNVYILTTNICGLETGGTVGELWLRHRDLAEKVANEVIEIQESLCDSQFEREPLIEGMLEAFRGDPDHKCMGRSAPARLQRALQQADAAGLAVPTLREIQAKQ